MKRLAVLRHAKSSWDDPRTDDHDRPLNDRGRAAAAWLGGELARRAVSFDLVLASTASRVRETVERVGEGYNFGVAVSFDPALYMADEEQLLGIVRDLPESVRSPLLIGHNPGLQRLIVRLTDEDERGLRREVAHKFPTAALAFVDLPVERWAEAGKSGLISDLIVPPRPGGER